MNRRKLKKLRKKIEKKAKTMETWQLVLIVIGLSLLSIPLLSRL